MTARYHPHVLQSFPSKSPAAAASFVIDGIAPSAVAGCCCCCLRAGLHTLLAGLNTLSFTVNVVDINQPRPFVPNFSFSFQVFLFSPPLPSPSPALILSQWVVAGAVLALAALLIFALYLYLRCWVVVNNARANTGSLPICFASMPEYRGW